MILLAGIPSEPPLALAIASAERLGIPHVVLNQRREAFCDLRLEIRNGNVGGRLWLDEREWPLSGFRGIYARMVDPETLPERRATRRARPNAREIGREDLFDETFQDWLEIAPGRVANRPGAMASNASKPFQAQLIVRYGFLTPATVVTNVPAEVRAFQARHRRIVFKSISSVRSIVQEWRPGANDGLDRLRRLPTQFQAFVPGENVRVHVAGDAVFATAIRSEAVDYRYAGREGKPLAMEPLGLPRDVEEKCVAMTRGLGLVLAGIDLKRTPAGEWYCFEVNTAPGYSYYQEHTGQPIAEALVGYLALA
jgi:hypothetical protein